MIAFNIIRNLVEVMVGLTLMFGIYIGICRIYQKYIEKELKKLFSKKK